MLRRGRWGGGYGSLRRVLHNALSRYRRVTPRRLAADHMRAFRLRRSDPVPSTPPRRAERLVVAMSTVPERVAWVQSALRSLIDQTCPADRILLAWPTHARRSGRPYPETPSLPSMVELIPCVDEGPATKLLAALRAEPDAAIVIVDDDVIYPKDLLQTFLESHRAAPGTALGLRGWRVAPGADPRRLYHTYCSAISEPTKVDILLGTWGYLLPPGVLDRSVYEFDGWPPEVRWVDDVWISGHLARRGIPRCVIPLKGFPIETAASAVAALTDGPNRSGHNDRVAINAFAKWW